MSITEASNATAAAPALDTTTETAENMGCETTVEEPSKEVSKKKYKPHDVVNYVFGS